MNKAKLDKASLISKIQQTSDFTNEEKSSLMALVNEEKKYGLVWEDSPEEVEENLRSHIPVLREVTGRALTDGGADAPNHILIEGDNLDALTALSYTHENSIDVIYIDPPYNTGNEDFAYNDKYVNSEDSYRHSKWLSFMNRRLRIAKRLLSDKGVIFISIDDREEANLRLLCNEIFGEFNCVEEFVWQSIFRPSNMSKTIRKNAEYILFYAPKHNDLELVESFQDPQGDASLTQNNNAPRPLLFPANYVKIALPNGTYLHGQYGEINVLDDIIVENGTSINAFRISGKFKWSQEYLDEEISKGVTISIKSRSLIPYYRKDYQKTALRPTKLIPRELVGDVLQSGAELEQLFGTTVFNYPKPTSLIKHLLFLLQYEKDITILDFFAGSGTTLHATMQLNAEDGGHRQCIMVTNNENGICENVTYERNKRVIQGYTMPNGQQVEGLHNNNLRYYKIDYTDRAHTHENRMALAQAMTESLKIKNGAYEAPAFFGHLKVKPRYMRYFRGDNDVLVVYVPEIIPHLVNEIKEMSFIGKLQVYVAIDGNYPFADEFTAVASKVDVVAIPSVYYHALKHVLPDVLEEAVHDDTLSDKDKELLNEANINDYQD